MSSEPTPHDPWLDLADRVSTGEAIDFAALEAEINDPSARDLLRAFSTLSSIGQLHSRHHLEATRDAPTSPAAADPVDPVDPVEWNPKSGPTWGGLTLVESLGRGASGEVHRAHDPRLQRDVALKLLHPHRVADRQWADAMLREGRALARVDHPNVVRVHGAEKHDGQWGLWMELVEGTDLDRLVQQQGRLSSSEATLVGERVARALSAVHAAGIVHRDIKAQNVMRAEGGRIVLMDFGSSREERDDSQSQSGITGTPLYMAPELFEDAPASVASDVYAVGVLLFYLATGSFPVTATSFSRLAQAHAQGERRSLLELRADLPAEFVAVVETALSADPDQRFTSAAQMAEALARSRGATGLAHPPAPLRRIGRRAWAAAAVVVLGAAAWSLLGRGPAPPPVEFEVEAALLRYHEDSTEELFSGAQLAVEQDLGLRLSTDAAVHLYVIDQDAAGNTFVLFPLRGGELQNPLPAGTHELPGRLNGEDVAWTVTSEGGQEQILLVASREPLTGLEARIADVARAGESSPYARVDAPVLEGLRGIGGLSARPPTGEITKSQPILEEIEELVGSSGRSSGQKSREGVWIRRIVLRSGGS